LHEKWQIGVCALAENAMLEVQNNLIWLPMVTNVPILLALRAQPQSSANIADATSWKFATQTGM
jgi:hypothetical protein